VALLAAAGGFYLWFRAQVSEANQRVPEEVMVALTGEPSSTLASAGATVEAPESPSAMNLLVLGSDRRPEEAGENGRSDTIILVHIDPDNDYLSVLSLPRDLRVEVPGHGMEKINAAYSFGGAALSIKTVEQVTGVDIDHYVEVDFEAFKDMTDALGGVYVDVDQRYYSQDPDFEMIDLQPGYQLMGGADALDYVRFRHDKNMDFGRMEKQQRFLSELREQAMGWNLALKLPGLVRALFSNIATDLGANDFIKLAWWLIGMDGSRIRQLTLVGDTDTIAGASYVLLDEEALAKAVRELLTLPGGVTVTTAGEQAPGPATTTTTEMAKPELEGLEIDLLSANGRGGEAAAAAEWLTSLGATVATVGNAGEPAAMTTVQYPSGMAADAERVAEVVDAGSVTRDKSLVRIAVVLGDDFALPSEYALPLSPVDVPNYGGWKEVAQMVPYPVMAPSYIPRGYSLVRRRPEQGATYDIQVGDGTRPAFTMLYRLSDDGDPTDQYMSITETTWLDAPAAASGRRVVYDGTVFTVVGSSEKVARVWWKTGDVLYWVSNTLSHFLSEEELLAMARCMVRIPA
jgi:LCP family protein required for cell wall assembly